MDEALKSGQDRAAIKNKKRKEKWGSCAKKKNNTTNTFPILFLHKGGA